MILDNKQVMHAYGIDIANLGDLVGTPGPMATGYGSRSTLASTPQYRLEQLIVNPGQRVSLDLADCEEATLFAEEGSIQVNDEILGPHMLANLPPFSSTTLVAFETSVLYVFYGPGESNAGGEPLIVKSTEDYRDKYWGNIQTVTNKAHTGKRLFFRKGKHSSLHFHCNKTETYFIHSGELYVRLRAGRGEDRFLTLLPGNTLFIPPGLMHQDGAKADTVIIEISTHDEDSDSFIVEDGATKMMPGLPS